jgi:type I restriction enzyme, S subunit
MEENEKPKGWVAAALDDVANWGSGGTPSRQMAKFYTGSIPWIKTGELGPKIIKLAEEHITEEAVKKSSAKVFPKGSIGIAMYGATIGKLSIWGIDASTNQACAVAQPYDLMLSNEFLYYYLGSEKRGLVEAGKGGAQPNISQGILKEWPILLPPLNEQHRIVAKIEELFSELDKGIENLKTAREQLKVYRQAVLKHAFEGKLTTKWREENSAKSEKADDLLVRINSERKKKLNIQLRQWIKAVDEWNQSGKKGKKPPKPRNLPMISKENEGERIHELPNTWHCLRMTDILISLGQGWSPKCHNTPAGKDDWGVIKTSAIQHLNFIDRENKRLPDDLYPRPWLEIAEDDLLITRAGPRSRVGVVCRVKISREKLILCDKAYRLRLPNSEVSPTFMEALLNTSEFSRKIEKLKTGINDSGVNITQPGLLGLYVPIPPINEQLEIERQLAACLSVIDKIEKDIDAELRQSEALRQSILKKAFTGQLVHQNPNDEPASFLLERIKAEKAKQAKPKKKKKRKAKA